MKTIFFITVFSVLFLASAIATDSPKLINAKVIMKSKTEKINGTDFTLSLFKAESGSVLRVDAVGEPVKNDNLIIKAFSKNGKLVSLKFIIWAEGSPGAICIYYDVAPAISDDFLSQVTLQWKNENKNFDLKPTES